HRPGPRAGVARALIGRQVAFFFRRSFLHLARKVFLGLPLRPCASACLEHSSDSALRGWLAAFLVLAAAGGVCAIAALAQNEPTIAAMRSLRIWVPCCCGRSGQVGAHVWRRR